MNHFQLSTRFDSFVVLLLLTTTATDAIDDTSELSTGINPLWNGNNVQLPMIKH